SRGRAHTPSGGTRRRSGTRSGSCGHGSVPNRRRRPPPSIPPRTAARPGTRDPRDPSQAMIPRAARNPQHPTLRPPGRGGRRELAWRLEFSNLTGNAIAAHIHVAARGVAGPVRVPLCAPCTSGVTGTATINADVLDAILNDRAYVNVHTPTNPAGEIRDQVSIVASVKTTLRAAQERPKPKGKLAKARGT